MAIKSNQFPNILKECVGTAVDNYSDKVVERLRKNVQEMWYDQYDPIKYNRSWDVLNSIRASHRRLRGGVGRAVYFDTSLIRPQKMSNGLHRHISMDTGSNTNSKIVDWMNSGFDDNMSFWDRDPRGDGVHFIERTQSQVGAESYGEVIDKTIKALKEKGIIARSSRARREIIGEVAMKQLRIKVKR